MLAGAERIFGDQHHLLRDLMCKLVDQLECTPQIEVLLTLNGEHRLGVVALTNDVDELA
jgi:hypothetical protein